MSGTQTNTPPWVEGQRKETMGAKWQEGPGLHRRTESQKQTQPEVPHYL